MFPLKNTDGQQQESKNKLFIQGTFKKHFLYTYYVQIHKMDDGTSIYKMVT